MDVNNVTNNQTMVMEEQAMCMPVPPWFPRDHWPVADFPFMTLQIQLIVVYCVTQAIHRLFFKRFALPPLLSQLLAGLVLSPTIHIRKTNVLWRGHDMIFPPVGEEVRRCISMLGYGLSLFMTAVKMDLTVATKMGKRPLIIGLSVLIITGATSSLAAYAYARANFKPETDHEKILNLASAAPLLALTSFPVIGALLSDMKLLNSELGRLALSSGIICDATSIAFNMLSKTVSKSLQSAPPPGFKLANELGKDFVLMAFLVSVVVVLRGLLNWMIRETPKGRPVKQGYLTIVFTLTLMGGILTHSCGEFVLLGFFVIGIAIPEGPPLGSGIVDKFDFLVSEVLQPFFVTTCAMRADVFDVKFTGSFAHGVNLLILCAYGTKLIVCLFHGVVYKMAFPDALAFAVIMSSKGFVDVANFAMFRQSELIWKETYSYLILVTTIAAFVGPMSIKLLYNPMRKYAGYKKRCIMRADNDADLRVLACVCRPDNISALTSLIAQSNPTMGKPLIVDVLQLLRLKGRAQPIFIDHNKQQKKSSCNQFEDIIWAFNSFKQAYSSKALSMNYFTMVSPTSTMQEDVCTLALNNSSCLIILPFHRKLNADGHMEVDDYVHRALNKSVLDLSPCSVAILVDRGYKKNLNRCPSSLSKSSCSSLGNCMPLTSVGVEEDVGHRVGVVFIGGKDDQEAVTYAMRIASERVRVEVIRVMGLGDNNPLSISDCWALEGVSGNSGGCNSSMIGYNEVRVKDGCETAKYLWSIIEEYDLIIVGRRIGLDCVQTSGLEGWSEVPELGTLGDLLAQPDLKCKTSVLVVQQQKQWTCY